MAVMEIHLRDSAAEAIRLFAEITGRRPTEVVSDALKTYEWVLTEQAYGRRIIAIRTDDIRGDELALLIENCAAATKHLVDDKAT